MNKRFWGETVSPAGGTPTPPDSFNLQTTVRRKRCHLTDGQKVRAGPCPRGHRASWTPAGHSAPRGEYVRSLCPTASTRPRSGGRDRAWEGHETGPESCRRGVSVTGHALSHCGLARLGNWQVPPRTVLRTSAVPFHNMAGQPAELGRPSPLKTFMKEGTAPPRMAGPREAEPHLLSPWPPVPHPGIPSWRWMAQPTTSAAMILFWNAEI
ncbi:uncharacterized protein LOC115273941 isoform X4 [Suricata suricatta]|uniref:uncharacterized protein LOC115273941 isoform X4 n=1 Tax=Suricata suricatta TaxID=37032 RepID=UPI0011558C41|nr:uncharacterized protein LOC115273941 isoform X4 [Suricata suricatta]